MPMPIRSVWTVCAFAWFTINAFEHSSEVLMKLTPGKLNGLKRVSNDRGVIAAAAMDQRGSLQKALAKEKGGEVTDAMMQEFKSLVTEVLTPHATAILLDPEWGLPASKRRAKNAGLLLAYEKTGYDKTGPGRLPDLLDHWSARRLKEAGANCVKILLYYTPLDSKEINDKKQAADLFLKAASVATKPFIYLSAGVSNAEFTEALDLAGESGVKFNGVLCGRATWKEGIPVYAKQGADAFRKWLQSEGVKNINNVNQRLKAATSWYSIYEVEPAMAGA